MSHKFCGGGSTFETGAIQPPFHNPTVHKTRQPPLPKPPKPPPGHLPPPPSSSPTELATTPSGSLLSLSRLISLPKCSPRFPNPSPSPKPLRFPFPSSTLPPSVSPLPSTRSRSSASMSPVLDFHLQWPPAPTSQTPSFRSRPTISTSKVASKVADASGEVIRKYFRHKLDIFDKEDSSPVKIADQTAEGAMVSIISENLPSHAMYTTSPHLFSAKAEEAFIRVRNKVKVPLYGCDCYAYALLASGFVDLVVESGLKPYDFLSLIPVIEGAGGVITDWKAHRLYWDASPNSKATSFNVVAAGDKQIHQQALDSLQWQ